MSEIRPIRLQKQLDGSPEQNDNCVAASAADAVLRARKNVKPATSFPWVTTKLPTMSSTIRQWCNAHFDTSVVKGLYQKWVIAAVKAMYGVSLGYAFGVDWNTARAFLLDHRGTTLTINYALIQGTQYAASGFYGRHRIYLNEERWNAAKNRRETLVYDPLADGRHPWIPTGPQWWPNTLVRRAAESAGIEVSYTPRTA
jgi:hypothetical protein